MVSGGLTGASAGELGLGFTRERRRGGNRPPRGPPREVGRSPEGCVRSPRQRPGWGLGAPAGRTTDPRTPTLPGKAGGLRVPQTTRGADELLVSDLPISWRKGERAGCSRRGGEGPGA